MANGGQGKENISKKIHRATIKYMKAIMATASSMATVKKSVTVASFVKVNGHQVANSPLVK